MSPTLWRTHNTRVIDCETGVIVGTIVFGVGSSVYEYKEGPLNELYICTKVTACIGEPTFTEDDQYAIVTQCLGPVNTVSIYEPYTKAKESIDLQTHTTDPCMHTTLPLEYLRNHVTVFKDGKRYALPEYKTGSMEELSGMGYCFDLKDPVEEDVVPGPVVNLYTLHRAGGYAMFFRPSLDEVLHCIPQRYVKEGRDVMLSTDPASEKAYEAIILESYHIGITRMYTM